MRKNHRRLVVFAVLAGTFLPHAGFGGSGEALWPAGKTVALTVGYVAGGEVDISARYLSEYLAKELGVNVVVNNIGGGNGSIAMNEVIAKKDPNTFLVLNTASLSANCVTGLTELTYKDMDCVSIYGRYSGETLFVSAKAPYNTFKDFMESARKSRMKMGVAAGGALYAACRAMMADGQMDFSLIDAGDGIERIVQVANGNLDATFASYAVGRAYVNSSHVKPLATLMSDRLAAAAPDMPSISEYIPSAVVNTLFVILSPKGVNSERDLDAFAGAIINVYDKYPQYVETFEKQFYQSAKPMTRRESLAELEKQYQHFQGYKPYLK